MSPFFPFLARNATLLLVVLVMSGAMRAQEPLAIDTAFTPTIYGFGSVSEMVWNSEAGWLYCRVKADRMNGQELRNNIIRFDIAGEWDDTWELDADGDVTCIALGLDGQMLVGMRKHNDDNVVFLLNAEGGVVNSFTVSYGEERIEAMAVDPEGNIYVGTRGFRFSAMVRGGLYLFDSSGSGGEWGAEALDGVRAIAIDAQGYVWVGGYYYTGFKTPLLRFSPDGSLDESFAPSLALSESYFFEESVEVHDLVIDGSQVWVAGLFREGLVKMAVDGAIVEAVDLGSEPNLSDIEPLVRNVAIDNSGNLYYAGAWYRLGSVWNIQGEIKSSQAPFAFEGFAITEQGPVYGIYREYDSIDGPAIDFSYRSDNEPIRLYAPRTPNGFSISNDGGVFCFGPNVREVDGVEYPNLVAFNENGSVQSGFELGLDEATLFDVLSLPDGRLVAVGNIALAGQSVEPRIVLLESDGTLVEGVDLFFEGSLIAYPTLHSCDFLWLLPSGKVLVGSAIGGMTSLNGVPTQGVALLDFTNLEEKLATSSNPWENGIIDDGFQPLAYTNISDAVGYDNGQILITAGSDVALYNVDGTVDDSFAPVAEIGSMRATRVERDAQGRVYLARGSIQRYTT